MNKEVNDYVNQIWNKEAKRQFENELSFCLKEKIELPDGKDYLKIFAETHKTDEQIIEELQQENQELNDSVTWWTNRFNAVQRDYEDYKSRIEKAVEYIKQYSIDKNFSFPLMKRWEENQVKSSIDYEFSVSLKKDLLDILNGRSDE